MRYKVLTRIIGLTLCAAIALPVSGAYADSRGKVGEPAVFNAVGSGNSQTGGSNTDTNENIGEGNISTDSTADKHNKEVNEILSHSIETIKGTVTDNSGITGDGKYIWIESMLVPVDVIKEFLNQATYNKGNKYESIDTSDRSNYSPVLNNVQKDIMNKVINSRIGEPGLENDGTKASNSNMVSIDFSNSHMIDKWPNMTPSIDREIIQDFITYLKEHGYTIPGYGEGGLIDFEHKYDRYEYIKQYLNFNSITDTVNVQHVIEYSVSKVTEKTLYKEQQVEYPGGGYYHWDIKCIDADEPSAIGKETSVRTPRGVLVTQFGTAGVYQITARENIAKSFVSTVTYDIREYWILADTGQVIYKKISNGTNGALDKTSGRLKDHNTVYYNLSTEYNYGSGDETAISGQVIYDTVHTVTADMLEGVFPATGVYSNPYNTVRIE